MRKRKPSVRIQFWFGTAPKALGIAAAWTFVLFLCGGLLFAQYGGNQASNSQSSGNGAASPYGTNNSPYGTNPAPAPYGYLYPQSNQQQSQNNSGFSPFSQGQMPLAANKQAFLQTMCANPAALQTQIRMNSSMQLLMLADPTVQKFILSDSKATDAILNDRIIRQRLLSNSDVQQLLLNTALSQKDFLRNPASAKNLLSNPDLQIQMLHQNPQLVQQIFSDPPVQQQLLSDPTLQQQLLSNPVLQQELFDNPIMVQQVCSDLAQSGGIASPGMASNQLPPAQAPAYAQQPYAVPGQNQPSYPQQFPQTGMQPYSNQVLAQPQVMPPQQMATAQVPQPIPPQLQPQQFPSAQPVQPMQQPPVVTPQPLQTTINQEPNPYYDVPSLYDLYQQVSPQTAQLTRFGSDVFLNGTGNTDIVPMDLPAGPDYVVGPGDTLNIELWGGYSDQLQQVVDREGRVQLPEVGTVLVEGRSMAEVQGILQTVLRRQFRDVRTDVSLARVRTVRVYVVGDVMRPGAYDISSLSTPLNALFVAGGPSPNGSLRTLEHYRGRQLIQSVDVYDLILHGIKQDVQHLESGDTILIPPVGPQITVEGMVRRPAIYELRGQPTLAEALQMAGGVLPSGTLRHVEVERVEAHQKRSMLKLDLPENNNDQAVNRALGDFKVQDGDVIDISPILPYDYQTVYLDGHVFHPGKYPYHPEMHVSDLIKTYGDLLPEPYREHAEIIRLSQPDFRPEVLAFNLSDALAGKINPELQPFDTVRVFSRYDFEDAPVVTVSGEVRDPGSHRINGEMHLRDAVFLAGGLTPDAMTTDAQIFRKMPNGRTDILNVNLAQALSGSEPDNILLQPLDEVLVHRNLAQVDPPTVFIHGQVAQPGQYPLGLHMTASELIQVAGGLLRGAYREKADLARYITENGQAVQSEAEQLDLARILGGDKSADVELRAGDVLSIREITGWKDIGSSIAVDGEVGHPGTYGIREGERLSSILKRAGGFRSSSYPEGAVLIRQQVLQLAEKSKQDLIQRIQDQQFTPVNFGSTSSSASDQADMEKAFLLQQQEAITRLKNVPASGRLVLRISPDLKHWANTADDIEVRDGDILTIPKKPNFIMVSGEVYNPNAISYRPGKNTAWYLTQGGGMTELANKKDVYVIRANGSVVGHGSAGWWGGNVMSLVLEPGDTVVVPEKILLGNTTWHRLLEAASLVGSIGLAGRFAASF
jgi:protein involved in polysaccharide export with SLBB domain